MSVEVKLFTATGFPFVIAYDVNELVCGNRDADGELFFPRRLHMLMYDEQRAYVRLEPVAWPVAEALSHPQLEEFCKLFRDHRGAEDDAAIAKRRAEAA